MDKIEIILIVVILALQILTFIQSIKTKKEFLMRNEILQNKLNEALEIKATLENRITNLKERYSDLHIRFRKLENTKK